MLWFLLDFVLFGLIVGVVVYCGLHVVLGVCWILGCFGGIFGLYRYYFVVWLVT